MSETETVQYLDFRYIFSVSKFVSMTSKKLIYSFLYKNVFVCYKIEMLEVLLELPNVDVHIRDRFGRTAFKVAAEEIQGINGHCVAAFAKAAGYDIDYVDKRGNNALMRAVKHGNMYVAEALSVYRGFDVNAQNKRGWTALMYAAQQSKGIAEMLLKAVNVDVNIVSIYDNDVLMIAALYGDAPTMKLLLADGRVNKTRRNEEGTTATMLAARYGKAETLSGMFQ